ncbi:uncharacterized protein FTJAE_8296 [Fusarium tjaetaba]|uniref:Mid2 domain-containing protein n=1 Tax=Fusarium tjaetaba TaxID=1567544 RepID=A0A8H5R8T5_9HYPO|nr:uncharacterized protein FTJAE_8296 [Fusarium tjaetaba]KAF5630146.1 hypothetical protein FTJAE_8296 [Fusarium tjaetaba]
MLSIPVFVLIVLILANHAYCKTKFLRPPQYNETTSDHDYGNNPRFAVGYPIKLLWETDAEPVELSLLQFSERGGGMKSLDASLTEWKAERDVFEVTDGNDDSVYCFYLRDSKQDVVTSQYFNVTALKADGTNTAFKRETAILTSTTLSLQTEVSITEPISTSTSTDQPVRSENSSESGMSKGEIAGAACGGIIGGLLLFGLIGWLGWRRLARNKKHADIPLVSQNYGFQPKPELPADAEVQDMSPMSQNQPSELDGCELKSELAGDTQVQKNPLGYARSPGGLNEAP